MHSGVRLVCYTLLADDPETDAPPGEVVDGGLRMPVGEVQGG